VTARNGLPGQLGVLGSGVILGLIIRTVQSVVLARLLGVAEFGRLAAVVAFAAIAARVNDMGLPNAAAYFFRLTPDSLRELLRTTGYNFLWCALASTTFALLALHLPLPFAADLGTSSWFLIGLVAYTALTTPASILPVLVTGAGDYQAYVRLTNGFATVQLGLVVGSGLVFGFQYQHVIGALALGQLLLVVGVLLYLRRYLPRSDARKFGARSIYGYGLRSQWGALMKLLSNRLDILIVGALMSASEVGLYSLAVSLREIGLLPLPVYAAPLQNAVIDRGKTPAASDKTLVLGSLILQFGLSTLLVLIAAISLPYLIRLVYGPNFAPGGGPATLLFTSILFLGPAAICWITFNAKGRPGLNSVVMTVTAVVGAVSTYLLASRHGLYGAATAVVVTSAVGLLLSLALLARLQNYRLADLPVAWSRARLTALDLVRPLHRARGTSAPRDAK
jgi:O-antigen/teichoic acid export membrane protein